MKKVILHVGSHKTGTTSLQAAFQATNWEEFDCGTRYAAFKQKNHSTAINTLFSEDRYNLPKWKNSGTPNDIVDQRYDEYKKILMQDIKNPEIKNLFISGEGISFLSDREKFNLCEFFRNNQCKVEIIAVVRDPYTFAISSTQQRLKNGIKNLNEINPRIRQRLKGFLKCLPKKNINVYRYEDLTKDGLISSFSKILGVTLIEPERKNESVSQECLALIYELNNCGIETRGSKQNINARAYLISNMRSFFALGRKSLGLTKIPQMPINQSAVEKDLKWLSAKFNVSYEVDLTDISVTVPELSISTNLVKRFFHELGFHYDPKAVVRENLKIQYQKLVNSFKLEDEAKILLKNNQAEQAKSIIMGLIDSGDNRNSVFALASQILAQLNDIPGAIKYAQCAMDATDNSLLTLAKNDNYLSDLKKLINV